MQKKFFEESVWKDGVYQLQCCGEVLVLLDTDSSDSGSSGEEGDDI